MTMVTTTMTAVVESGRSRTALLVGSGDWANRKARCGVVFALILCFLSSSPSDVRIGSSPLLPDISTPSFPVDTAALDLATLLPSQPRLQTSDNPVGTVRTS